MFSWENRQNNLLAPACLKRAASKSCHLQREDGTYYSLSALGGGGGFGIGGGSCPLMSQAPSGYLEETAMASPDLLFHQMFPEFFRALRAGMKQTRGSGLPFVQRADANNS